MATVAAFHSKNPNVAPKVYHDNNKCEQGNNIEKHYLASGTDSRPKCKRCTDLAGK
jgi:CRISPR/Cas system CMR-associated protein Cmr5 small subunit